jgi:hypothetical protein
MKVIWLFIGLLVVGLLGYWLLVIGYWVIGLLGYWLLVIGYWLLGYWVIGLLGYWVIGYWLFAFCLLYGKMGVLIFTFLGN